MLRFVVVLIFIAVMSNAVYAQTDTPTPTETPTITLTPSITPTPTNTPTPTPDLYDVWTLPPPEVTGEATPEAGQAVAVKYEVTAGDVAISMLLFALLVTIWSVVAVMFWRGRL